MLINRGKKKRLQPYKMKKRIVTDTNGGEINEIQKTANKIKKKGLTLEKVITTKNILGANCII